MPGQEFESVWEGNSEYRKARQMIEEEAGWLADWRITPKESTIPYLQHTRVRDERLAKKNPRESEKAPP